MLPTSEFKGMSPAQIAKEGTSRTACRELPPSGFAAPCRPSDGPLGTRSHRLPLARARAIGIQRLKCRHFQPSQVQTSVTHSVPRTPFATLGAPLLAASPSRTVSSLLFQRTLPSGPSLPRAGKVRHAPEAEETCSAFVDGKYMT